MNVLDLIHTAETLGPTPLPEHIASYEDPSDPAVRGPWQIENANSADWALQRLAECEAEAESIDAQVKAAVERLRARGEELKAKADRGAGFFRFKLLDYAERHRSDLLGSGKKKSREFLHGKIGWRKKAERLEVEDRAALVAWLEAQPSGSPLVRWKAEPVMDALQAHFKAVGEVPPGTNVRPETEEVYVEAIAPETALAKE